MSSESPTPSKTLRPGGKKVSLAENTSAEKINVWAQRQNFSSLRRRSSGPRICERQHCCCGRPLTCVTRPCLFCTRHDCKMQSRDCNNTDSERISDRGTAAQMLCAVLAILTALPCSVSKFEPGPRDSGAKRGQPAFELANRARWVNSVTKSTASCSFGGAARCPTLALKSLSHTEYGL